MSKRQSAERGEGRAKARTAQAALRRSRQGKSHWGTKSCIRPCIAAGCPARPYRPEATRKLRSGARAFRLPPYRPPPESHSAASRRSPSGNFPCSSGTSSRNRARREPGTRPDENFHAGATGNVLRQGACPGSGGPFPSLACISGKLIGACRFCNIAVT